MGLQQIKSFCKAKEIINIMKRVNIWNGRKCLQTTYLISGSYQNIQGINTTQHPPKILIKKWKRTMNNNFSKENIQMTTGT